MATFLSGDPARIKGAESELLSMVTVPGFGAALCDVALDGSVPDGIRQLSGVMLRVNVVKRLWIAVEGDPVVSDAEKAYIRERLPAGLADRSSRVRTSVVRQGGLGEKKSVLGASLVTAQTKGQWRGTAAHG